MSESARVTFTRTHKKDVGQRQVIIAIDEGTKTTLMFGDTVALDVAPGDHVLKAHNTLVRKSMPFHVKAGEQVTFTLINHPGRFTLGFLALMGVAPLFLTIEEQRTAITPSESTVPDRA